MKILKIVGARGAGKSTALEAMMADRKKATKQVCERLTVMKGNVRVAKYDVKQYIAAGHKCDQLYVDFEGRPTTAFMAWLTKTCEAAGVKFLVIAHGE